ncbi:hypothetical protein AVEN_39719-1 [Araneus ventricosus]|uniref:Uncharacterized protein n=1 Tax=Araneus ventricosus TaxID=182803 RepID=A0A4Y2LZ78_ARAVE|nr:hypothetical protein AVEN_39719-1 [Araneus ventricosus]
MNVSILLASLQPFVFQGGNYMDVHTILNVQTRRKWEYQVLHEDETCEWLFDFIKEIYEDSETRFLMDQKRSPALMGLEPSIGVASDCEKETLEMIMGLPVINFTKETTHHEQFWSTYGKEIKEMMDKRRNPTEHLCVVADYMENIDSEKLQILAQNLRTLNLIENFVAFILFTPRADSVRYKIYYTFVEINQLVEDNLKRCIEHNRIFGYEGISWRKLYKKYTRHRNCHRRMHFKYREIFATEKFFTFGKRRVADATYHVYQTLANQMVVYIVVHPDSDIERSFNPTSQSQYDVFVLEPETVYYVPPLTTYILMTFQATIFKLYVMKETDFRRLKNIVEMHVVKREWLPNLDIPPELPHMENFCPPVKDVH